MDLSVPSLSPSLSLPFLSLPPPSLSLPFPLPAAVGGGWHNALCILVQIPTLPLASSSTLGPRAGPLNLILLT